MNDGRKFNTGMKKSLVVLFIAFGFVAVYAIEGNKCTKCTVSSSVSNNTGMCKAKVNGLGDTCVTGCGVFTGCTCDGEVEQECDK